MNGKKIYPSKSIRYLGIHIDETLNFSHNSKILTKKLKRANGILSKARHFIDTDQLKTLYYAVFSSHLTYACQIWGQSQNTHNHRIFTLQNTALRIMTFSNSRTSSNPLYAKLKILKLKDIIILKNCLFVYDSLNKMTPLCFHDYFQQLQSVHSIQTKSASLGCVYVTTSNTKRYGLNSITKKALLIGIRS